MNEKEQAESNKNPQSTQKRIFFLPVFFKIEIPTSNFDYHVTHCFTELNSSFSRKINSYGYGSYVVRIAWQNRSLNGDITRAALRTVEKNTGFHDFSCKAKTYSTQTYVHVFLFKSEPPFLRYKWMPQSSKIVKSNKHSRNSSKNVYGRMYWFYPTIP